MTQKELACQVGVSRQTMNAIENGRHAPTVTVAIKIANVLGVAVDQLFELDYEGKSANRAAAPRFATDPVRRAAETTPSIESSQDQAKEAPVREVTFADLRNVVG